MTTSYIFPEAQELARVEQVLLPALVQDCPFFPYFPFEGKRETLLRWTQRDNYQGLQSIRGYGGKPNRITLHGDKVYYAKPGVYGDFVELEEEELTRRRDAATLSGGPIGVADLVAQAQEELLVRRVNRQAQILSALLVSGTFSVTDPKDGTIIYTDSYTQQTVTASIPWSTHTTSTPIADLRSVQLKSLGQSVNMGSEAVCYINRVQFNHMLSNTNAADLGGRRLQGLMPANSAMAINQILLEEGLPRIEVYEGGYYPDASSTFTRFIPTGKGVVIGKRLSGARIGSYRYTLNDQNPEATPAPYTRVIDKGLQNVPRTIEVHDGHNGGVTLEFPGTIVLLDSI